MKWHISDTIEMGSDGVNFPRSAFPYNVDLFYQHG